MGRDRIGLVHTPDLAADAVAPLGTVASLTRRAKTPFPPSSTEGRLREARGHFNGPNGARSGHADAPFLNFNQYDRVVTTKDAQCRC